MTMYLPNSAVRSAESDSVEFLDLPPMAGPGDDESRSPVARLSPQARIDITRRAHDYISELVAHDHGNSEDVRWIIRDLNDQFAVDDRLRGR